LHSIKIRIWVRPKNTHLDNNIFCIQYLYLKLQSTAPLRQSGRWVTDQPNLSWTVSVFKGNPTLPSNLSQWRESSLFKSVSLRSFAVCLVASLIPASALTGLIVKSQHPNRTRWPQMTGLLRCSTRKVSTWCTSSRRLTAYRSRDKVLCHSLRLRIFGPSHSTEATCSAIVEISVGVQCVRNAD
jgi:hypothetical protein